MDLVLSSSGYVSLSFSPFFVAMLHACGVSDAQPEIEPRPWQSKPRILTTRPPGSSPYLTEGRKDQKDPHQSINSLIYVGCGYRQSVFSVFPKFSSLRREVLKNSLTIKEEQISLFFISPLNTTH